MLVTFTVPGDRKNHTYGPYDLPAVPRKGDRVEFDTVSYGRAVFNVGGAEYKFVNPHHPTKVVVSIYGPLSSNPSVAM